MMFAFLARLSPTTILTAFTLTAIVFCALSVLTALSLRMIDLPTGATPTQVGTVSIIATDLIEEPDQLADVPALQAFFERQSLIVNELDQASVEVSYTTAEGQTVTATMTPRSRTLADLPFVFWFQQGVGIVALLVGGWVLSLRRTDWGALMFGAMAVFVPVFAMSAAVYSTRPIAVDGALFRVLSATNLTGAACFGIALVGLFLMYPRPMVHPRWLLVPTVIYGAAIIISLFQWSDVDLIDFVVMSQMLIAIILGIVQWWRSRKEPLDRAGLRWFFLVSLTGCSLFIGLSVVPPALGLSETGLISQGYAFGFFNLMHIGVALGLTRYRVFELDRYAYYIWLWLGGALMLIGLDLLLLTWLQNQPWASLGLALLIGGFLYFPLRQYLLRRFLTSKTASISGRVPEVLSVGLSPTERTHADRWDALLNDVFQPASGIAVLEQGPERAQIAENGLGLHIPAVDGLPARELRYAAAGRRLFGPQDADVADNIWQMHRVVADSRRAYETGVNVERDRISKDVHDNIGAQLLTALHSPDAGRKDDLLRDTLSDLRNIINDGFRARFELPDIAADLRSEVADRLEAHSIGMDWPTDASGIAPGETISFLKANALRSILREVISNTIKHAKANTVHVRLSHKDEWLRLQVWDDGAGFDLETSNGGNGLSNIQDRAQFLHGAATWDASQGGGSPVLTVDLPTNGTDHVEDQLARPA